MSADWRNRLIVGITGASGAIFGVRLLEACRALGLEVHLCVSKAAELTLAHELEMRTADLKALAHRAYAPGDVGAAIASGSFKTRGMIVAPCSIRTMSEIACGTTVSTLTRAADRGRSHHAERGAAERARRAPAADLARRGPGRPRGRPGGAELVPAAAMGGLSAPQAGRAAASGGTERG